MRSSTRPLAALVLGLGLVVATPLSARAVAVHTTLELQEQPPRPWEAPTPASPSRSATPMFGCASSGRV